ncbi:hypothetical protein ABFT80_01745 [Mesorhizobium sp. SB112]|uniref:hypothetical protein n=1 Tax=Mesorhizobium sp. SB112 TaxID=3151853 RepID=UPI003264C9E7
MADAKNTSAEKITDRFMLNAARNLFIHPLFGSERDADPRFCVNIMSIETGFARACQALIPELTPRKL